jgi:hypothetical protein
LCYFWYFLAKVKYYFFVLDEQPETGKGKGFCTVLSGNCGLNWLVLGSFKVNLKLQNMVSEYSDVKRSNCVAAIARNVRLAGLMFHALSNI